MTGAQIPRVQVEPARYATDGGDAAQLMAAYGNPLDEWQRRILDCWLGRDAYGHYTMTSAGLSVPRQNGKNVCLEGREFFGLVISGKRFCIQHTRCALPRKALTAWYGCSQTSGIPKLSNW